MTLMWNASVFCWKSAGRFTDCSAVFAQLPAIVIWPKLSVFVSSVIIIVEMTL